VTSRAACFAAGLRKGKGLCNQDVALGETTSDVVEGRRISGEPSGLQFNPAVFLAPWRLQLTSIKRRLIQK
jgi:hypothetical protein